MRHADAFTLSLFRHTWFSTTEEANIPIAPTPQHSAKLIFEIFKAHSIQSGENLTGGVLNAQFLSQGGRAPDYEAGLRFAIAQGWIKIEPTMIQLTDGGFAAM